MKPDMVEQDVYNKLRSGHFGKYARSKVKRRFKNTHEDSQSNVNENKANSGNFEVTKYSSNSYLLPTTSTYKDYIEKNSRIYKFFLDHSEHLSFKNLNSFVDQKIMDPFSRLQEPFFTNESSLLPDVYQPNKPVTHEYLWLKKSPSSMLHYRILEMAGVPYFKYKITIEVPVADGVVCGTNCVYEDLLKNQPPADVNESYNSLLSMRFYFRSRHDNEIFIRTNPFSAVFDVCVTSLISDNKIVMKCMTEDLWNRLSQAICVSKYFYHLTSVRYSDQTTEPSSSSNLIYSASSTLWSSTNEAATKHVCLSIDMLDYTKAISSSVELLDAFRSLPIEDQLILLKEGLFEASGFLVTHNFSREDNSIAWSCFDSDLLFMVHMNVFKFSSTIQGLYEVYSSFQDSFSEFLRFDSLVINILCILCIFKERSGVSSSDVIEKERKLYFDLLDKYFQAKLSSGNWKLDLSVIWNQIHYLLSQVSNIKVAYEKYHDELMRVESEKNRNPVHHEFVWLRSAPNSNIEYRVIDLQSTPYVDYRVVIQVKVEDGVVVGTGCSWTDIMNKGSDDSDLMNNLSDKTCMFLEKSTDHRTSFRKRLQNTSTFDVEIFSSISKMKIILESMNNSLWKKLSQVIDAAVILRDVLYFKCAMSSSSAEDSTWKQIEIVGGWATFVLPIFKVTQLFQSYRSLSENQQLSLTQIATTEIVFTQFAAFYDKSTNSLAHATLKNHLLVCNNMISFKKIVKSETFIDQLVKFMSAFEDFLRKDEVFMTITSLLFLFKESTDNSNNILIPQERTLLLELLDKYIKAKVQSKEWITSYEVTWKLVKEKITGISYLKSIMENLSAKQDSCL